jgi:integration host factor subunit beta
MIKSDLLLRIYAQHPHLSQRAVAKIVDAIFGEIEAAMVRGDRVELRGFGAFSTKHRSARSGRNPKSGASVAVPDRRVPWFNAAKEMRERLNKPQ